MRENVPVKKEYVYGNMILVQNAYGYNNFGKYHCSGDKKTGEKFYVSSEVYTGGNFIVQLDNFVDNSDLPGEPKTSSYTCTSSSHLWWSKNLYPYSNVH